MPYVYKIVNDLNQKIYVGKTYRSIEERFKEHCFESKRNKNENRPLYKAMNKYGIEHFHIYLLEETDIPEEREKYWIEVLGTFKDGYNATTGGDGKPYIDYEKIYNLYKQGITNENICKIVGCESTTIRKVLALYNISKEERIEKARDKHRKSILMIDKNTNEVINSFSSLVEAGKYLNKPATHIQDVCHGRRKTAYGFKWEFADKKQNCINYKIKPIKCINTNEIFSSSESAAKYAKIASCGIRRCCNGLQKSAGKHPETGERLYWEYAN